MEGLPIVAKQLSNFQKSLEKEVGELVSFKRQRQQVKRKGGFPLPPRALKMPDAAALQTPAGEILSGAVVVHLKPSPYPERNCVGPIYLLTLYSAVVISSTFTDRSSPISLPGVPLKTPQGASARPDRSGRAVMVRLHPCGPVAGWPPGAIEKVLYQAELACPGFCL